MCALLLFGANKELKMDGIIVSIFSHMLVNNIKKALGISQKSHECLGKSTVQHTSN